MKRVLLALSLLAATVPAAAVAADAARGEFAGIDTTSYPSVRATFVTNAPTAEPPSLTENGIPVVGLEAVNLGRAKSIVLAVDRSRSMRGEALLDAAAAARSFVTSKFGADRIAVVAFGSRSAQLTGFSTSRIDADGALRALEVDGRQGTALHDAVVQAAEALRTESLAARVIIVLTDGRDVSSTATMADAIAAAKTAGAAVYPVAIEGPQFSPAPLQRLARETGGRYSGASSSAALSGIYASIAQELRRTWLLTYVTSSRPGDRIELAAGGTFSDLRLPGRSVAVKAQDSNLPDSLLRGGPALAAVLVGFCIFGAAVFVLKAPHGTGLRRRIVPHLGLADNKRTRGTVEERWATASTVMRATERAFGHLQVWHSLHRLLERADLPLRTVEVVYMSTGSALVLAILASLFGLPVYAALLGLAVGAALPVAFVAHTARKRLAAIDAQLPDLLITLAASLKAGHSFRQAIQAVVDEGQPPASKEFKRVLTETSLGRPMDDALAEMAERVGSKNLSFVVTAVTIQRQVGGSLAGIFDMVADAVRQRQQFARKIRSLTAQGRLSAYVLVALPIGLATILTLMNPEYMDPLYHTSAGHILIVGGIVMMSLGSLVLKKIVSFKG
jgi:tight adherence protein B